MPKQSDIFFAGGAGAIQQPVVGQTVSFTPSYNNVTKGTSPAADEGFYNREGKYMVGRTVLDFGTGGGATSNIELNIPDGLTIDSTIINTSLLLNNVGTCTAFDSGNARYMGHVTISNTTTLRLSEIDGTNAYWSSINPFAFGQGDNLVIEFRVPIAEWSESELVSTLPYEKVSLTSISSGTITGGQLDIIKVGNLVTITQVGSITHASASIASTAVGFIPERFRPQGNEVAVRFDSSGHLAAYVQADGLYGVGTYRNYSGAAMNRTSASQLSITYVIA